MAEILRKRDRSGTGFTGWAAILLLAGPLTGTALVQDQEMRLEAAMHREIVLGDLRGAVEQYKSILAEKAGPREVSARALLQMGECLEKMGLRMEAHDSYSRLAREYGDQAAIAGQARARLAGWEASFPGPRNLRFEQGSSGKAPPGWIVSAPPKDVDQWVQLRRAGCRGDGGCAVMLTPENAPFPLGRFEQDFKAVAYRGKKIVLRAWIRLEAADPEDRAQMWLSVDGALIDNMRDRPVRSAEWTRCEIAAQVGDGATSLQFGFMSSGRGRVWVDDVSFEVVP